MARGFDKHQERLGEVARLGKDLARRAGRRCEWCEERDELRTHDLAPDDEPDLETLALLCARCRALAAGRQDDPRTLRFLETAIWAPVPALATLALQVLRTVDAEWARAAVEAHEEASGE